MNEVKNLRNVLTMKYPASWHSAMWREAMPVGNGEIGALCYGGVYKEIIAINHSRLWRGAKDMPLPDISDYLPDMRKLLADNKPIEAENIMRNALENSGYSPVLGEPLPLCDIEIVTANNKGFKNYIRSLDMEKAEAVVRWQDGDVNYERKFFASAHNNNCYMNFKTDNGILNTDITLKIHDEETLGNAEPPKKVECFAQNGTVYFAAENDNSDYGAVLKVAHNGEELYNEGIISIKNATQITAVLKVFINTKRKYAFEIANSDFGIFDYDIELDKHCKIHTELFNRQTLNLGGNDYSKSNEEMLLDAYSGKASTELIEKLWSFGRYLLICASKPKGLPCHLYGIWTGGYSEWWAFNMFNVNLEMIYWQTLSGGMFEVLCAVFDYVESKLDDYRENAKKIFGCRGINIPSVSTPESGLYKCIYPHILHWTGAAAWVSQFYNDYWLYTGDIDFLKNRALPFMKETVMFYEDYLFEDKNGKYVFSPSNSPENTPSNILNITHRSCEVTVNATMDIALCKEVITNLIKGAELTKMYVDETEKWKNMLKKLPEYEINEDGAVKEWISDFYKDNYEHRHLSHIYPIFPGYEYTRDDNNPLYNAFKKAVMLRQSVGLKDQSGWSLAYMSNIYARMGMGDNAVECIDLIARSVILPNLFSVHNDWRRMGVAICGDLRAAPIQLDADMGITSAINEMLVSSTENKIYLFNAIPKRFLKGSVNNIYTRAGYKVTLNWNVDGASALFENNCNNKDITVILPENMEFILNNTDRAVIEAGTKHTEFQIRIK